ncbi:MULTISPECIES: hypothetical protein [unclassified Thioalkalivibrio]|uniref:hypothetical protein n=1 Tax=unclassified Thioalkalivibrio TaxID=2621013 RepID=UPI000382CE0A|nr:MULTISPECIES: hypothetical protein [unclassified Thioalkalivibrio]
MTESFDRDWLDLREPADHAARPQALVADLCEVFAGQRLDAPLRITDLGSGTGSNLRYLALRLANVQHWRLLDHDAALLERAQAPRPDVVVETCTVDFGDKPARMLDGTEALVTGSALLDLVSEAWLRPLLESCVQQGAAVLFALSYDGRIRWSKTDPLDEEVEQLVNRHQQSDKGFGRALGPAAATCCAVRLEALGYRVRQCASDWHVGSTQASLGRALIEGWVVAATEMAPKRAQALREWGARRTVALTAGDVELTVGHQDVLGYP